MLRVWVLQGFENATQTHTQKTRTRYQCGFRRPVVIPNGCTITAVCTCVMVHSPMGSHNCSISQQITLTCLAGSRAWKLSFVNMGCGQWACPRACMLSARTSSASMAMWIAAAGASYSSSWTLLVRSHNSKSKLSHMATSATFIPNTIVSSTSSSNTGVQPKPNTA